MHLKASAERPEVSSDVRAGVRRWLITGYIGSLFPVVLLFLSAGRWDWAMGWALVGLYLIWHTATALIMMPRDPELLAERGKRQKGKTWDTVILSMNGLTTIAKYVVAGLDVRYGWPGEIPLAVQIVALVIAALGYALLPWAMASNPFLIKTVRIQTERRQTVATGGPYQIVRHPTYLGTIMFELATPIMLGSLWALILGGLAALLFVLRTALEDRTLQEELDGYKEYAAKVRYRLLPGIW